MEQTFAPTLPADHALGAFVTDWPYCFDTGLLTRSGFLERASGEMQRAQRFQRDLAIVTVTPLDAELSDEAFEHLCFFAQESMRDGIDLAGLTGPRTITLLLPETDMLGAMDCALRLRALANSCRAPRITDFTTRETVLRDDDTSLKDVMTRGA